MFLFAQRWPSWSFSEMAIALIIILAICAVVWVFIKQSGIPIPSWVVTIAWIVGLAFLCILAIRILTSM